MNSKIDFDMKEPLISRFTIEGLFGYKTVSLDFSSSVKIVSAENGTGKTTLLNALYWTLTGQFFRLQAINFDRMSIQFQNGENVEISKIDVTSINLRDVDFSPSTSMRRWGLTRSELTLLMETYLAYGDGEIFTSCEPYIKLYHESPWDDCVFH